MVGQYQGPDGTAALAVVAPIWNILYSMGLLMGIGGSVLFSNIKGKSKGNEKQANVFITGFSTFFIDVAVGILTVLFNRQILKYLGTNALAVYGIIVNISSFVQCCAYSVGQAAQPIISMNLGAKLGGRIKQTLRYALGTAAFFSIVWTVLSLAAPMLYVRIFMTPTEEFLKSHRILSAVTAYPFFFCR